jgi:hypothetical protein
MVRIREVFGSNTSKDYLTAFSSVSLEEYGIVPKIGLITRPEKYVTHNDMMTWYIT